MSLVYSDTTNLSGILQLIEKELEFEYGYITGNPNRLKEWTAEINLTHDEVMARIFKLGGTWQPDDTNHDDYPIITANLVSGQRDYTFTTDEQGNVILDIFRVLRATPSGVFEDITPRDQQQPNSDTSGFVDGQNLTGTPDSYDKTANGIFLDKIPNYNYSGGLKVFINREGYYFTTSDTTRKPGIDGLCHEIYVVSPCYKYATRKGLQSQVNLERRKMILENTINERYGRRERDTVKRMTALVEDNR